MTTTEYLLNIALIGLVVMQRRGRRLTPDSLLAPLVIVGFVAAKYLHGIPTADNDLVLIVGAALVGAALGSSAGLLTRILPGKDGGVPIAKATLAAAGLWIVGIGARIGFALYATHGGSPAITRFSAAHGITSMEAWVAALVLMSLTEVTTRTLVLAVRSGQLKRLFTVRVQAHLRIAR